MQLRVVNLSLLIIMLFAPQFFLNISTILSVPSGSEVLGYVGTAANSQTVLSCNDEALVFVECQGWQLHIPSDYDYRGTVVVIDDGLSIDQWKKLENGYFGFQVDIVRYVTPDVNGFPISFGDYGDDSLTGLDNSDLGYFSPNGVGQDHGFAVISALATIVPNVKIIFVNAQIRYGEIVGEGFQIDRDVGIWTWLRDNANVFDIDVITISLNSGTSNAVVSSRIEDLYAKGIFMISSIGNEGIYQGNVFPQSHSKIYAVGSVDHEDRGTTSDPDKYSKEGFYSGFAVSSDLYSSYGGPYASRADSLDFTMPGNGVPIVSYNQNQWVYGVGTSFSAPYLAAAALIAVYAYNQGYLSAGGVFSDPSAATIYSILKSVSSQNRYDSNNGWGYVTFLSVYNQAYSEGYGSITCGSSFCLF